MAMKSKWFLFGFVQLIWLLPGILSAQPAVRFTQTPDPENDIATTIMLSWEADEAEVEFRYKLDVPGDWLGGIKYAQDKWSEWGDWRNITYNDFILEGRYNFVVEARKDANSTVSRISTAFSVHFFMPKIFEEAVSIDWRLINAASTHREKLALLANEYKQAYEMWMQKYEAERRALDLTWSGDEFVEKMAAPIVGKASSSLLQWADVGVAASLNKILLPKVLYDIIKQGGLDLVLIYRNVRTNTAAFSALNAYWAWKGYERLAQ